MKGIVGRKVGMTQVFDEETGALTPVTVIAGGPVPGRLRAHAGRRRLRRGAARVRRGAGAQADEARARTPEASTVSAPHRELVEIRGEHQLAAGDTVTVEAFEPGEKVKVSGVSIGKGFQGTIKRHKFSRGPVTHGSHNVRKPGSVGASAYPSRVFKGVRMAGHMGAHKVTQRGLTVVDRDAERTCCSSRAPFRDRRTASS